MSHVTLHLRIAPAPGTCTPSLTRPTSLSSDPLLGELQPCADQRQLERVSLAEPPSLTENERVDKGQVSEMQNRHSSRVAWVASAWLGDKECSEVVGVANVA